MHLYGTRNLFHTKLSLFQLCLLILLYIIVQDVRWKRIRGRVVV